MIVQYVMGIFAPLGASSDRSLRVGLTSENREQFKALKRDNRELRRSNEILV